MKREAKSLAAKLKRSLTRSLFGPTFATADVRIGRNVRFGTGVVFNAQRVRIGDGVIFGDNVLVDSSTFEIGDYGTIYRNGFFPGPGDLRIGHNFWLGTDSIVDAQGTTVIGDNVCVGVRSQLWTHMKFGDVMAGCNFYSASSLTIDKDVWIGANCLVSPIHAKNRSLALAGSVVTSDMEPNHVYGGVPAKDMTDVFGPQFTPTSIESRMAFMKAKLESFAQDPRSRAALERVILVQSSEELADAPAGYTVFDVSSRVYRKQSTDIECRLMRYLLPEAKFTPSAT